MSDRGMWGAGGCRAAVGWAAVVRTLGPSAPTRRGASSMPRAQAASDRVASASAPQRQGFTLIELLVALAVFSLAAMALLNLSGENTRSASRVETRTLGGVVAENLAVEAMVQPAIGEGEDAGETPLAGRPWRWTRTVTTT